ncbi:hypothetical protein GOP47_0008649, partial [Adiantum capillus-veneris]
MAREACAEDGKSVDADVVGAQDVSKVPTTFVVPAQLRPHPVCSIHIPLIDLSRFSDADGRSDVLKQIHRACCDWGFFQVLNHGVSLDVLHSFRTRLHEFFAMPTSAKRELGLVIGDTGQGYGAGFVDPKSGTTEWKDFLIFYTNPPTDRDYSKWPPSLRDDIELVGGQMLALSRQLLVICSENLGLPSSAIEDAMDVLHQKILVAHYPACPQPELAMGSCEHTDVGTITCVWQASEDVVALQVLKDEQWHSVEPFPGAIVVNVGDQME